MNKSIKNVSSEPASHEVSLLTYFKNENRTEEEKKQEKICEIYFLLALILVLFGTWGMYK